MLILKFGQPLKFNYNLSKMNNVFRKMFSTTKPRNGKKTFSKKFTNFLLSFRREKSDKSSVTSEGLIAVTNALEESREQSAENMVAHGFIEPAPTSETECDLKPKVTITRLVDLTFYLLETQASFLAENRLQLIGLDLT